MKRLLSIIETFGSLLGFFWLLGPPSWQEVNRGVTYALLVTLGIALICGIILGGHLYTNQRQSPYE